MFCRHPQPMVANVARASRRQESAVARLKRAHACTCDLPARVRRVQMAGPGGPRAACIDHACAAPGCVLKGNFKKIV